MKNHRLLRVVIATLVTLIASPTVRSHAADLTPAEISALGNKYIDPSEATGSSMAVVVGDTHLAHTALILPLDSNQTVHGLSDAEAQARKVLQLLAFALKKADTGIPQIAKLNVYLADSRHLSAVQKVISNTFSGKGKPAICFVVGDLPHPNVLVGMDAVATTSTPGSKTVIRASSEAIHQVHGHSHVAILPTGSKVYVSGQAVRAGDLATSTRKTMEQLEETLRHLGLGWQNVVQIKSFLQPMGEVEKARDEIGKFFGGSPAPPLVFVEWTSTTPIEIELIAAGGLAATDAESVEYITPTGMKASPVFCRVVRINFGKNVYISGLLGDNTAQPESQVRDIFSALRYLSRKTGSDMRHLVKATYYVTDSDSSALLNKIRPEFYDAARPPSASKAAVKATGFEGNTIAIDMVAATTR